MTTPFTIQILVSATPLSTPLLMKGRVNSGILQGFFDVFESKNAADTFFAMKS